MAVITKVLYREFEDQKLLFGQGKIQEICINLPRKFVKLYDVLTSGVKKMIAIEYEDDALYINETAVESQLFGPAVDGIIECTLKAIEETEYEINTFYLVGGFGGCKYVHQKLNNAIKKVHKSKMNICTVIVPPSPHLSVAQGAALWRKNPEKIRARRSDATYGIGISMAFDAEKHDDHYKYYSEELKEYRCKNIFGIFLEKGELASADKVSTTDLIPTSQANKKMVIAIYSTVRLGVLYTKDRNGKDTLIKIGQIIINIPNPDNLPREKRIVDVSMDFSGTEIQAKAKYRVNGKEVKTVCDFLSAQY